MKSLDTKPKYLTIVLQSPPYAGSLARSALDLAMSYAVFSLQPQLLFTGVAVRALDQSQAPAQMGRKSLRKVIDSLPLYDVEEIYADEASLAAQGLSPEALPDFVKILNAEDTRSLTGKATHVISL